jgi:iron complex outermembrane receptor protein
MIRTSSLRAKSSLALLMLGMSSSAFCQATAETGVNQLEDIVVTAQKRAQNIQKVPVAVSAISGEALGSRGLTNVEDLRTAIPGLNISINGGVALPFLRGVGNPGTTLGNESSVAIYVDGVYYSRLPAGVFSLNNLERVEVLKGPQGTLFGRNSSGGVIQIVTRDPEHDPSMRGSLGYGRFDTIEGNLYATTGLSDTIAVDLALSGRNQGSGYGKYVLTGHRTNYQDNFSARSKMLFEPSDNTRVTLGGFYTYSRNNFQSAAFPGTLSGFSSLPNTLPQPTLDFYDQPNDTEAFIRARTWGTSLKLEQEVSFARLQAITAYMKTNQYSITDSDFSSRPDGVATPSGYVKQFTQELQAASLSGSPVEWVVGFFYFNTVSEYDERTRFSSPSGALASLGGTAGFTSLGRQHVKSYAAYGQASYELLPRLKATGGLRYTWDRITADGALVRPNGTFLSNLPAGNSKVNKLSFRAALDYQFSDDVLGYASFSRGFKSAVFNLLTYNNVPNRPEQVDAYEVGFKSELFDRRVRFNAAAFYYEIQDPQVVLTRAPSIVFSNAGKSTVKGVEADLQALLATGLTARASANYLDSKYKDFGTIVNGVCVACAPSGAPNPNPPFGSISPLVGVVANGNQTPYVSKFTANIGLDYEFDAAIGKFLISADYSYNDGFFSEPDNFLHQKAFSIVNAQVKFNPTENLGFRIWGKNLLDKKYIERMNTNAGPAGYTYMPAAPLTFGAAIDVTF